MWKDDTIENDADEVLMIQVLMLLMVMIYLLVNQIFA